MNNQTNDSCSSDASNFILILMTKIGLHLLVKETDSFRELQMQKQDIVSPLLGITPRKEGVRIHWLCQTEKERYRNKRQDFYKSSVFANLLVDKRQPLADANKQQFIKTGRQWYHGRYNYKVPYLLSPYFSCSIQNIQTVPVIRSGLESLVYAFIISFTSLKTK